MVSCTNYIKEQDVGEFYADTEAELENLPNLTDNGKAELKNMNSVKPGSTCMLPDGTIYILTGENQWQVFGE